MASRVLLCCLITIYLFALSFCSLQDRVRASRLEVLLRDALGQAADETENLPVVIPQPALGVEIRRREACDVAIALGMGQRGRALNVGVRGAGRRGGCDPESSPGPRLETLLQHQLAEAAGGLGEIGLET